MADGSGAIRLLQVAQRYSNNPTTGAELRIYHLASRLARQMSVIHLGFAPPGTPTSSPGENRVEFVPVARRSSYRIGDLVRGAFGREPFSVLNYTRESMKAAIRERLEAEEFDIVLLESVHLGAYVPLLRNARRQSRIVCDWHNIESEVLSRYGDSGLRPLRRRYARHNAPRLLNYERWFLDQCDLHIAVSERDCDTLARLGGGRARIVVIDNGVDAGHFAEAAPAGRRERGHRVVYVGSMDAFENADAVTYFASKAWPLVRCRVPDAVFTIVGRNPSREVRALARLEGVEVTGLVEDVRPYYSQAFAAVAPLRVAGGTRLKILEAMAAGVPVVATSRGAEGLSFVSGEHLLLADSETGLAEAVTQLWRDEGLRSRMTTAASTLVRQKYDWSVVGDRLTAELLNLIRTPKRRGAQSPA
jgi:polysaccharide biosynthesis protein PslH